MGPIQAIERGQIRAHPHFWCRALTTNCRRAERNHPADAGARRGAQKARRLAGSLSDHLSRKAGSLNQYPFDLVKLNLVLPAVVELGRARRLVVGDVLRGFKRALVLQVRGDAGRPEGVVPDPRLDAGAARAPPACRKQLAEQNRM